MSAASHGPRQLRSAVKMKPRNRNSSQIGASTHVSTALSTSSTVLWRVPSVSSSFSLPECTAADQMTRKTMNATPASSTCRTARPRRVGRRPNCHALSARPPSPAKNSAASTKATSWTAVSAITIPGGTCDEVIFTPSASAGMSTSRPPTAARTSPTTSAAGAIHAGHPPGPPSAGAPGATSPPVAGRNPSCDGGGAPADRATCPCGGCGSHIGPPTATPPSARWRTRR